MLRLPAGASVMEDHHARDLARFFGTEITLHETKCQVDPGCHAGRCPDLPIGDEDPVQLHARFRIAALQFLAKEPMRGHAATIEKPRLTQDEGTHTDRRDAPRAR
jgi:hypothetical protein